MNIFQSLSARFETTTLAITYISRIDYLNTNLQSF